MDFFLVRFVFTFTLMPLVTMARTTNLENNDINDIFHPLPEKHHLPECTGNMVCAMLQANSRGINAQQYCSCQGSARCSLLWDIQDGHSITQGSDQYKYCRKAPVLHSCQMGMTAYTSVRIMSKTTGKTMSMTDANHCFCPEGANYDLVDTQFDDVDDDYESLKATYVCSPLRMCGTGEACKIVTESPSSFLVNPKCRCPAETVCPSVPTKRNQMRFTETTQFGNGLVQMIYCH